MKTRSKVLYILILFAIVLSACGVKEDTTYKSVVDFGGPCGINKGSLVFVYDKVEVDFGGATPIVVTHIKWESVKDPTCKGDMVENTFQEYFVQADK